jgi:hypothetical protein
VMDRGDRREVIFQRGEDRQRLLERIGYARGRSDELVGA